MATKFITNPQSTREIRTYILSFEQDLPENVVITNASATHIPPSGEATIPLVTYDNPYVSVTLGPLIVLGEHNVKVLADYSNGDKSEAKLIIAVAW